MSAPSYESGQRPARIEFVRESTLGTTPADPSFEAYSDAVRSFEPAVTPNTAAQDALGDSDSAGSYIGVEESELVITYDLQRWLTDGSGNAVDAAYDAFARDADNRLPNSHTVVRRMEQTGIDASNTVSGNTSYDTRQYWVGRGGAIDEAVLTGDPSEGGPVQVEATYAFERLRPHQIDQPDSDTLLAVKSSSSNDTSQSVTIEDEGASTTETVSLDGTTVVSTSSTFSGIDAVELSAETEGTVTVAINTGTDTSPTEGDALTKLKGTGDYDSDDGDLGVPALGSGSHAGSVGSNYELLEDGDTVDLPDGTAIGDNIAAIEVSVSNNINRQGRASSAGPAIAAEKRECEIAATVFGESEEFGHVMDSVTTNPMDFKWTFSDGPTDTGSLTISNAKVLEVGATEEPHQSVKEVEITAGQQEGVTIA